MKNITNNLNKLSASKLFTFSLFLALWLLGLDMQAQNATFNSGTSFVPPAGVTTVQVEAWGGGGAGAGSTSSSDGGGGGGGGGYSRQAGLNISAMGSPITIQVGTGGVGDNNAGNNGTDTWFNNATTVLAKGGAGGSVTGGSGGAGGTGGQSSAGIGTTFKSNGGNGGRGQDAGTASGGPGGSSGGSAANGVSGAASWTTRTAAAAPTGGGRGGDGGTGGNTGSAGNAPGAGGGGSGDGNNEVGGSGAAGRIVLTYTCPTYALTDVTTATGPFCGASTSVVTLTSGSMPNGSYTVTYNLSGGNTATGSTAAMTFASGSGTFTTSSLNASATPTVITITGISSGVVGFGACVSTITTFNTATVNLTPAPTAVAGTAVSTCANSAPVNITAGSSASNNGGTTWTSSGTGSFANPNSLTTATYTPSPDDITAGSVTITLTAIGNGSCSDAISNKTLTINAVPTAVAGTAIEACGTAAINITAGSSASNQASVTWTSNGTGSFANANSLTLATYSPSPADVTAGSRTLTLTANGLSGCGNVISTKTITITAAPTATAGSALSTCSTSGPVSITGTASNYSSILWTTNGTGTFTNEDSLTLCTYTPSAADITAGSRTITLNVTGNSPCGTVTSNKTLTINTPPTAVAGNAIATCSYSGAVNITSGSSAGNQASITWTSSGTGTFANATSLTTCTYNPSAADITAGSVTLTLTAVAKSGCTNVTSTKTMTITSPPAAPGAITGSANVCQTQAGLTYSVAAVAGATNYTWSVPTGWTITDGQGTTEITVTSGNGGQNGNVSVVVSNSCGSTNPALPAYSSDIVPVNATNNSGFTTSFTKTSGDIRANSSSMRGYAKFPLSSLPSTAAITGSTLTLTHNGTTTVSGATNDINALGNNDPVSASASTLYSAIASGTSYHSSVWGITGSLVLALNGTANADIQSRMASPGYIAMGVERGGTAEYRFHGFAAGANAPKLTVTYTLPQAMAVVVNVPPTAVAGTDVTTCSNSGAVNITAGSSATNNTGTTWTSNGTGTFANENSLTTATYTPSGADITAGTVTLTLTSTANTGCTDATSTKTLTINQAPSAAAGDDQQICAGATATMDGSFGAGATSGSWTSSGTGDFDNAGLINAVYTPSAADIAAGSVTLTFTSNALASCNVATDSMLLTIYPTPTAVAPADQSYCNGVSVSTIPLSGTPVGVTYDISGGLAIGLADATGVTAIPAYTPSLGSVTVTITPKTANCTGTPVTFNITVNPIITPLFAPVADICAGTALSALPTTSTNGITGSWSPALNNMETTTYTFTPDSGQCTPLTLATLTITVNTNTMYYEDFDGDGYGNTAVSVETCLGQPTGYVLNNTDCDDTNDSIYRNGLLYADFDQDGYNDGLPPVLTCYGAALPTGTIDVNNGTDCNDFNFEVNLWHVEVLGNGIDDNCDGAIDEVGPYTIVIPSLCGSTLQHIANLIYVSRIGVATGYRFEVTNGATVRSIDKLDSRFSLLELPGGATYNTTYAIRCAVQVNGFWQAYGPSCNVTTPTNPATTSIVASQCGSTLTNISASIYCNQVTQSNQYRFEVSDGVSAPRTFDSPLNRFNLMNLVGGVRYATTYSVRVALRFGAIWQAYGDACNITTPATPPTTNLVAAQCGITINNYWTTLYANQVAVAEGYRFEVTNGATVRYYNTSVNRFALRNITGTLLPNTVYTVRVAILYNSVYQDFGDPCTVTTSPTATRQAAEPVSVFDVKTYPNPYVDSFKIDMNTSSEENVDFKVYDMLGRQVEASTLNVNEVGDKTLGAQYPSGVYNIIVTQGDNVKTLRVIKR